MQGAAASVAQQSELAGRAEVARAFEPPTAGAVEKGAGGATAIVGRSVNFSGGDEVFKFGADGREALRPVGRTLGCTPRNEVAQRLRRAGFVHGIKIERLVEDAVEDALDGVTRNRLRAGHQFEQHHAEGVDVHLLGDVLAGDLLRRHVIGRAEHVAGACHGEALRFSRCRNPSA